MFVTAELQSRVLRTGAPPPTTQTVFQGYFPSRLGLIAKNSKKYENTQEKQRKANKIGKLKQ
jgi:hypothetical protein